MMRPSTTPVRPLVFVSVGTDHHPFDRLLRMIEAWAVAHPEAAVLVQRGHTRADPSLDTVQFMGADELAATLAQASAVVCHGGPSSIMEARAVGHTPIVVARDPSFGEHVDGHQLRFVKQVAADGLVVAVQEASALDAALAEAIASGVPGMPAADREVATASIERIGDLLDELIDQHSNAAARKRT